MTERKAGIRVTLAQDDLIKIECHNGESQTAVAMTAERAKELRSTLQSVADQAQDEKAVHNRGEENE